MCQEILFDEKDTENSPDWIAAAVNKKGHAFLEAQPFLITLSMKRIKFFSWLA